MTERVQPVALVTGAGRGLGRAIASALHESRYKVAVTDVDEAAAVSVARSLSAERSTAHAYPLDVSSAQQVADVFASVARDLGVPDALVNNAGVYPNDSILDMPEAAWDRVLDINLKGPFLCSQAFARMRPAATGGVIVNVASTAAFSARVGAAHYSASKAGLVMLTKSLAQELGPYGIRVNAVAPGLVEVEEGHVSAEYKEMFLKMIPRGRIGRPEDIAAAVSFLLTDAANYINGECIAVDGGFLTGRPLLRSSPGVES
jgi:NAD(P)-dependent dehydrogenase (short-subunit alcohol dehydrogenase family)